MKNLRFFVTLIIVFLIGISMSSCLVVRTENRRDNGKHLGWFKKNHQHKQKVYIVKTAEYQQPKAKRSVVVRAKKRK